DEDCRSTGAAANLQQMRLRPQPEPGAVHPALVRYHPAILPDVLAKGFAPHSRHHRMIEATIGRVVGVNRLVHPTPLRASTQLPLNDRHHGTLVTLRSAGA